MTRWEQKNGETGQHSLSYNSLVDYDCGDKYMVAVFSEQYSDIPEWPEKPGDNANIHRYHTEQQPRELKTI